MVTKIMSLTLRDELLAYLESKDNMSRFIVGLIEKDYNDPLNMTSEERQRRIKELKIRKKAEEDIKALSNEL